MVQNWGAAEEWHIDGTFQCVPQHPRAAQLLIISMRRMDVGIPALYILCSHRTAALYNSILNWILQEAPEVRENLQTIVSDFEVALLSSVQVAMPWVRRRGRWFHFARSVTRKWNTLRLPQRNEPESHILNLTWALPLVPANRFQEAIQVIVNLLQPLENFNDNYFLFRRYLQRFWLPQANTVSVCDAPWRTNNVAEAFNRHLLVRMGGPHPPLFRFLARLNEIILDTEILWNRLNTGMDVGRYRRRRQQRMDLFIIGIQQALETRRYSMAEFLEVAVVHRVDVQFDLDTAVTRLQYENDDLTMVEEVLIEHLRDPVNEEFGLHFNENDEEELTDDEIDVINDNDNYHN